MPPVKDTRDISPSTPPHHRRYQAPPASPPPQVVFIIYIVYFLPACLSASERASERASIRVCTCVRALLHQCHLVQSPCGCPSDQQLLRAHPSRPPCSRRPQRLANGSVKHVTARPALGPLGPRKRLRTHARRSPLVRQYVTKPEPQPNAKPESQPYVQPKAQPTYTPITHRLPTLVLGGKSD